MKNKHRITLKMLLLLVFSIFSLTGCWSVHESNSLAIVNVMGIDKSENGDFEISMITIRPEAIFSKGNQKSEVSGGILSTPLLLTTATGKSLYDAFQKLSSSIAKRLVWTHMDAVVFGEKLASEGIEPVIDTMLRDKEFRPNLRFLITKGKALDILKIKPQSENTLGQELSNLNRYSRFHSSPIVSDLAQFSSALASDTNDPLTGEISKDATKGVGIKEVGIEASVLQDTVGLNLNGLAVFKRDKLVGWLNDEEARSVGIVRGQEQSSIIVLDCPSKNGVLSVETTNSSSHLTPSVFNGRHRMDIAITVDSTLKEVTCSNLHLDPAQMEQLNTELEKKIKGQVTKVLTKVQTEWQTDIFGFGEVIYKHQPRIWKELAPTWRVDGLRNMPVKLHVNANIARAGLIHDPLQVDESR